MISSQRSKFTLPMGSVYLNCAYMSPLLKAVEKKGIAARIMVDFSHGNSNKNHKLQASVFKNCLEQRVRGAKEIFGLMLESNLNEGKQDPSANPLKYGVSITDACISFDETRDILLLAHKTL